MNTTPDKQRKALGRGFPLFFLRDRSPQPFEPAPEPASTGPQIASIPIANIQPNPLQPRSVFDATRLEELANSIETHGIIQPTPGSPQGLQLRADRR